MEVCQLSLKYPIDIGAPTPKILASEHFLLLFYFVGEQDGLSEIIKQRDVVSDRGVGIIRFNRYLNFKFGSPNSEVLNGHPYFKFGLRAHMFYEIQNSDWIEEIIKINSVHPRHEKWLFDDYFHYVLTFQDSMFECIAQSYEVSHSTKSMGELVSEQVERLILTS